jgi:hypothetical protein
MGLSLRNSLDYGKFSAQLEDVKGKPLGNCIVEISIEGFFTNYKITKDKRVIFDQTNDEEMDMIFNKDYWQFFSCYHGDRVRVKLPFNKCLKRY